MRCAFGNTNPSINTSLTTTMMMMMMMIIIMIIIIIILRDSIG